MFYDLNAFFVQNMHYLCNYQSDVSPHRHCEGSCCRDGVRPVDWINAVGYERLKLIPRMRLQESCLHDSSNFDIFIEQNVKKQILHPYQTPYWSPYLNTHRVTDPYSGRWRHNYKDKPLPKLLHEMVNRAFLPGLSPSAIRLIVRNLRTDFGVNSLLSSFPRWNAVFRDVPNRVIHHLVTYPDADLRIYARQMANTFRRHGEQGLYQAGMDARVDWSRVRFRDP